jgi:hypothetical protein
MKFFNNVIKDVPPRKHIGSQFFKVGQLMMFMGTVIVPSENQTNQQAFFF